MPVNSPARYRRAKSSASRRSVLTRSPGLRRHFRGTHENAVPSVRLQTAAQGKAARPGFVTEFQEPSGVGLRQFFGQLDHVLMFATDDPVTANFDGIRRRKAHRDGIVMHVQPDEQDGAFERCHRSLQDGGSGRRSNGLRRAGPADFSDSTVLTWRNMYVFMVSVFLMSVVWGVSPTTCGSAPFTRCNPRLLRRADTAFTFIASHTV